MSDGTHTVTFKAADSLGNIHSSTMIKKLSVSVENHNISSEEPYTGSSAIKSISTEESRTSPKSSTTDGFGLIIGVMLLLLIG